MDSDTVLLRQDHSDGSSDFFAGGRKVEPPIAGKKFQVFPSNGVLLLVDYRARVMKLWNPTTGKFRDIPNLPEFESEPRFLWLDRESEPGFCAFWLDPDSGGFKIFIMIGATIHVLSSDSETWKTLENPQLSSSIAKRGSFRRRISAKAFIHGGLHFLAGDCVLSLSPKDGEIIARFRPPARYWSGSLTHTFETDVCNDRLCLKGLRTSASFRTYLEVWEMEEYGDDDSWRLLLSINPCLDDDPLRNKLLGCYSYYVCLVSEEPATSGHDLRVPLSLIQNSITPVYVLRDARRTHEDLDGNTRVRILFPKEIPRPLHMSHMLCLDIYTKSDKVIGMI